MTGADSARSSAVADEALRLVSALASMTTPPSDSGASTGASTADRAEAEHEQESPESGATEREGAADDAPGCSCANPSVQSICEVCPVCRVAAFLSEVRPETVERVADLLSMVAGSLEAFAAQRRAETEGSARASSTDTAARHDTGWESVQVEDEQEDGDA